MFNTLCLVTALMFSSADAGKKHHAHHRHKRPPPKAQAHRHHHHPQPARYVVRTAPHHSFLVWSWIPPHYNLHGAWIRGHWTFTYRHH